ncbi:MAG: cysteine desulfurase family protein [Pseudanabaenaceae cyanobacterium]
MAKAREIYLDCGATTPMGGAALAQWQAVVQEAWGNPSSLHRWGERAAMAVERGRLQVAAAIGAQPTEIVFTSGGTEADQLAILGLATGVPRHGVISAVEHAAVARTVDRLVERGWRIDRVPVDRAGRVGDLAPFLRADTAFVSLILGQNEVGTLQPVAAWGKLCREAGIPFHTDAVQAVGRIPVQVADLNVDLLSLSAHKVYGPQGVGALYVRSGTPLQPIGGGGGQEGGLRSGTPPVALIAAFGAALTVAVQDMAATAARLQTLRDRFIAQMLTIPDLVLTGHPSDRLPHHASFVHPRVSGRQAVWFLREQGIAIGSGSACSSGRETPSPVLLAMGYDPQAARGGIRITLGWDTTAADLAETARLLADFYRSAS